jgi:hypothetical protein
MRTQASDIERALLYPGAQQQQDCIHRDPVRNAGSVAAQRIDFVRRDQRRQPSSRSEHISLLEQYICV